MTRINLTPPNELCDQHLIAELHELPRIPNGLLKGNLKLDFSGIPDKYTLGEGHVKFFINKLTFLWCRYQELLEEAQQRKFSVQDRFPEESMIALPLDCWEEYVPTEEEIKLSRDRIIEKLPSNARYYGMKLN